MKMNRRSQGVALVLVLGLMVLIVSVVVAFLLSTSTERTASNGFVASVNARQVGDMAVGVVEAQINDATTQGAAVAWTSQPGMVRTFTQTGTLKNLYKLYSADQMKSSDPGQLSTSSLGGPDMPPADWVSKPSLWIDLNAPASSGIDPTTITASNPQGTENYVYPILDPRSLYPITLPNTVSYPGGSNLPGLNNATASSPLAFPEDGGLAFTSTAPALTNALAVPGVAQSLPMPVKWLYVLQDGTMVIPTDAGNSSVAIAETANNPVVGRVAFWTDDDTCKVNINTASEGTFWDTPHGYTNQEVYNLSANQPARSEYQRYPGHPATVSLSAVFPLSGDSMALQTSSPYSTVSSSEQTLAEQIYSLIPRITGEKEFGPGNAGWTSQEGHVMPAIVGAPTSGKGVRSDGERLFTSVDELLFRGKIADPYPAPTPNPTPADTLTRSLGVSWMTRNVLESRRFFLTAHSRAPETNLFDLPRIAMWPVYGINGSDGHTTTLDANHTNPFDRMIALCSSTGTVTASGTGGVSSNPSLTYPYPYFFERQVSQDNRTIAQTYGNLPSTFPAIYNDLGDPEATPPHPGNIPRNIGLYNYLRCLTSNVVPGYGGSTFNTKYGGRDRDQILTEMFDYIRCTNLYDDLLDYDSYGNPISHPGAFTFTNGGTGAEENTNTGQTGVSGHGIAVPIRGPNNTMGLGRYQTLRSLNLVVIGCAAGDPAANPSTPAVPAGIDNTTSKSDFVAKYPGAKDNPMLADYPCTTLPVTVLAPGNMRVQAMVVPDFYSSMLGWRITVPDMRVEIDGLDQLTLNGQNAGFPASAGLDLDSTGEGMNPFSLGGGSGIGGGITPHWATYTQKSLYNPSPIVATTPKALPPSASVTNPSWKANLYPFVGWPVKISTAAGTSGGLIINDTAPVKVTVRIYIPHDAPVGSPVQTIDMMIPRMVCEAPGMSAKLGHSIFTDGITQPTTNMDGSVSSNQYTKTTATKGRLVPIGNAASINDLIDSSCDVIRALEPTGVLMDYRLLSAMNHVALNATDPTKQVFYPDPLVFNATAGAQTATAPATLNGSISFAGSTAGGYLTSATANKGTTDPDLPRALTKAGVPVTTSGTGVATSTGDFDRGVSYLPSGALANKPDEGNYSTLHGTSYYFYNQQSIESTTFFSPNRMISSPVMFGSLPTGLYATDGTTLGNPWQTLLFRPLSNDESNPLQPHIGSVDPKDELLLDLFWMPVVDPYAISDRFSTAGKINLNSQIMPFTYIQRTTAQRAAMKNELMEMIPSDDTNLAPSISAGGALPTVSSYQSRWPLKMDQMLQQFDDKRFNDATRRSNGTNVFISPAEICEMYMTPTGLPNGETTNPTYDGMKSFWTSYRQTGDNMRERVYSNVYQKLTTRSNTYTVYFRAQSLKRAPNSPVGTWRDGRDAVLGEYRGSTTIERFIDPNATIPDYGTMLGASSGNAANLATVQNKTLGAFYKWRVVENSQFAP